MYKNLMKKKVLNLIRWLIVKPCLESRDPLVLLSLLNCLSFLQIATFDRTKKKKKKKVVISESKNNSVDKLAEKTENLAGSH